MSEQSMEGAQAAFNAAAEAAWAVYDKDRAPALADLQRAQAAYNNNTAPARTIYDMAILAAQETFNKDTAELRLAHDLLSALKHCLQALDARPEDTGLNFVRQIANAAITKAQSTKEE